MSRFAVTPRYASSHPAPILQADSVTHISSRHASPPPLVASWLEVQPLCPDAPEGEAEPWVPLLVLRRAHVFVVPPTLYSLYGGSRGLP